METPSQPSTAVRPASARRRQARRRLLAAAVLTAAAVAACGPQPPGSPGPPDAADAGVAGSVFVDRAAELGIDFLHVTGATGRFRVPEILGPGVALIDYDGDGDLDLYLIQGGASGPEGLPEDARFPGPAPPRDRLYRNQLAETGALAFTDVTEASGIVATGYGMGAAVGDVDGDGDPDLYLANYGPNQLWRNDGDGSFSEVAGAGGADDPRWSVPAVLFDADRDGDLDLYVGGYIEYGPAVHKQCYAESSALDYCGPKSYSPLPDRLFANRGDGTFDDVSTASRIATEAGPALGAVAADLDGDGWLDLYVANDDTANGLWINRGDGSFDDRALVAGAAFNELGEAESSMGVDAGDYDGDGDLDLFMTHIREETNTLYRNDGGGLFSDVSTASGLGPPSLGFTGFGTGWLDFDNDGRLDLLTVNGLVRLNPALAAQGDPLPFRQRNQLFRNLGGGRFAEVPVVAAGPGLEPAEVSRGAAFGDLDDDGDTDVVIANTGGPARLLINQLGATRRWLGVRLLDARGADANGARAGLALADGRVLWRRVRSDGSYASASDPRLLFALGDAGEPLELTVVWADGAVESWDAAALALGRYTSLARGGGRAAQR